MDIGFCESGRRDCPEGEGEPIATNKFGDVYVCDHCLAAERAEEATRGLVEILHVMHDDGCDLRVFINGVEVDVEEGPTLTVRLETVDPGRGWGREEWDNHTTDIEGSDALTPGFKAAVVQSRVECQESRHIS